VLIIDSDQINRGHVTLNGRKPLLRIPRGELPFPLGADGGRWALVSPRTGALFVCEQREKLQPSEVAKQ